MEGYSRDLLRGIGAGENGPRRGGEQEPRLELGAEEVELSLGLSLGGRFGLERRGGERLARSSSVACILAPEEVALPPLALARTSSLPTKADVEAGKKQTLGDWSGCRGNGVEVEPSAKLPGSDGRGNGVEVEPSAKLPGNDGRGNGVEVESSAKLPGSGGRGNGVEMEPAARLPASGSPSSGSSDGEGQRLKDTLMRTSSLPAGIEDEWRKRKEAQTLKRLEVKKKRIERRSSSNVSKEATGQILEEMNAGAERVQSCEDVAMGNKQIAGDVNHSNAKHHSSGLPPKATHTSQGSCLSGMPKRHNSAMKGTCSTEEQSLSSAVPSPAEGANGTLRAEGANSTVMATPSSSALAVRAAALGSRAEQQHMSGRLAARAKSMGDVERMMMQEMPCVCTKGLPNGRRVEGFLYKYRKGDEVRIVCVCHGSFLTPAEFVKHAGGGDVANPLRHIVVNPIPPSLF